MATSLIDALRTAWLDESKSSFYLYAEKPYRENTFYSDSAAIFCKNPKIVTEDSGLEEQIIIPIVNLGYGPNYHLMAKVSDFRAYVRKELYKGKKLEDIYFDFIKIAQK